MSVELSTPVGVSYSLLRLSIGLEDCDELIPDLDHALAHVQPSNHMRSQYQSMTPSTG